MSVITPLRDEAKAYRVSTGTSVGFTNAAAVRYPPVTDR